MCVCVCVCVSPKSRTYYFVPWFISPHGLPAALLMIGGVGTAHEWIIQPYCDGDCWRDLYLYEWCFHAACVLIGGYMISGLLTLATIYFDRRDAKQAAKEEYEDSEADGDAETVQ